MAEQASRRPRLLVLTSTLPRWSSDSEPRFVLDLARALADRFDPLIVAPMAVGAAAAETIEGVRIRRYRYAPVRRWEQLAAPGAIMPNLRKRPWLYLVVPGFLFAQLVALVLLLRRERFDVIHCHWLVPQGLTLAIASLFVRIPPVIVTCHGADAFTLEAPPLRALKNWVLRKADAVAVVSQEIGARLAPRSPRPLAHLPMGVDLGRFGIEAASRTGAPPVILFAGRLAGKKGVHVLLEALANPLLSNRGACLRIVGDGPLRDELQARAAALGIADRVTFVGAVPHARLADEMRAASIFCAPFVIAEDGDREGMPTVLLEAAAAGVPIVTSNVGGCRDLIESGASGWLLPPGDSLRLAGALAEALDDPQRAAEMAAAARCRVEDFSWPRIADRYAAILDTLVAGKRSLAHAG